MLHIFTALSCEVARDTSNSVHFLPVVQIEQNRRQACCYTKWTNSYFYKKYGRRFTCPLILCLYLRTYCFIGMKGEFFSLWEV